MTTTPAIPRPRVVITGIGLTAPNGNNLAEYRQALLDGRSGVSRYDIRYIGETLAGVCNFDETKHQAKKARRRGTRAGAISVYCAKEALDDAGLSLDSLDRDRIGMFIGTTEHGNVETEQEVTGLLKYDNDVKYWSHHHNPRTVSNNPAGEVSICLGITGPHYTLGAACAAGNIGLIQGMQQLWLDEVDQAICGGVSESVHTFGIFASFKAQGALAEHADPAKASRPFDMARNGIVISEGGCLYILERLADAQARGAKIYGEVVGWATTSDADDYVDPDPRGQARCMRLAQKRAGLTPTDIDILNTHATATKLGDIREATALKEVFGPEPRTKINNTKSYIGHAMGAAGALELAGNLPSFVDRIVHPTINVDDLDPECANPGLVLNKPQQLEKVDYIQNNSFGMLGISSVVIIKRFEA
ncbi:MAG: beta-ketoacyl synthase [Planctomycetota bacterium]